jgi:hypothetical protein
LIKSSRCLHISEDPAFRLVSNDAALHNLLDWPVAIAYKIVRWLSVLVGDEGVRDEEVATITSLGLCHSFNRTMAAIECSPVHVISSQG